MLRHSDPAALMPWLCDYLFAGVRARLGPGLLLPHAPRAGVVTDSLRSSARSARRAGRRCMEARRDRRS